MKAPPPRVPRYLPTLTEVVSATGEVTDLSGPQAKPAVAQVSPIFDVSPTLEAKLSPVATPSIDADALVERVMQRLSPLLHEKLHEVIASLVEQEVRALEPRLMQEVEQMTRQSVAQALADELARPRPH